MQAQDLAGLSAPLVKLMEVVQTGVGTVYATVFSRRIAEAQVEARLLAADADDLIAVRRAMTASAVRRIEADAAENPGALVPSLSGISPLAERISARVVAQEVRRERNISLIAANAAAFMPKQVSAEPVDPDWLARFFGSGQDVSTPELQSLWGEVLAREVAAPGVTSLKTLDVLRNMTKNEASVFQRVCRFVVGGLILQHNPRSAGWYAEGGVSYNDLLLMSELGLISMHMSELSFSSPGDIETIFEMEVPGGSVRCTVPGRGRVTLPVHLLTKAGDELFNIAGTGEELQPSYLEGLCTSFKGGMAAGL